jgi:chloramphenicol O-acetyltransferase
MLQAGNWKNRYTAEMKKIDLEKYLRRALLEAFRNREMPVFSVTGTIDITHFRGSLITLATVFSCS